jgi:hypothetical protein
LQPKADERGERLDRAHLHVQSYLVASLLGTLQEWSLPATANWITESNPTVGELEKLDAGILELARPRDGTAAMLAKLSEKYPKETINEGSTDRAWELAGLLYLSHRRNHEALGIF